MDSALVCFRPFPWAFVSIDQETNAEHLGPISNLPDCINSGRSILLKEARVRGGSWQSGSTIKWSIKENDLKITEALITEPLNILLQQTHVIEPMLLDVGPSSTTLGQH